MGAPRPPPPPPPPTAYPPPPPGYGAPPAGYGPYGTPQPMQVIVVVAPTQDTKAGVRGLANAMLVYLIAQAIAFAFFLYVFLIVLPLLLSSASSTTPGGAP